MRSYIKYRFNRHHTDSVSSLSFSFNKIASGGDDRRVFIWSPSIKDPLNSLTLKRDISLVKLSEHLENYIYVANENYLSIYDLRNLNQIVKEISISKEEINDFDLKQNDEILSIANDSGDVCLVNLVDDVLIKSLSKHDNICTCVKFRKNHPNEIYSGGFDCLFAVSNWDDEDNDQVFNMKDVILSNFEHSIDQDDSDNDSTHSFEPAQEDNLDDSPIDPSLLESKQFVQQALIQSGLPINPPTIYDISLSPTSNLVALALANGSVQIFDGSDKALTHLLSLSSHSSSVSKVHFINDTTLMSGGNDKRIIVYQLDGMDKVETVNNQTTLFNHSNKINAITGKSRNDLYVSDTSNNIFVCDFGT